MRVFRTKIFLNKQSPLGQQTYLSFQTLLHMILTPRRQANLSNLNPRPFPSTPTTPASPATSLGLLSLT